VERGGCCECLAAATNGSVERCVEVGEAGLRVVVEGAVVATEPCGAERALDGAEADVAKKVGVVSREVVAEPLYVHTDEDAAAGA
jgi:hypothetical protein